MCKEEAHLFGGSSQTENMTRPFSLALSASVLEVGLFFWGKTLLAYSRSGGDTMSGMPDSVVVGARRHRAQVLVCAWAPASGGLASWRGSED